MLKMNMSFGKKSALALFFSVLAVVLLAVSLLFLQTSCTSKPRLQFQKMMGIAQGSYYAISYYADARKEGLSANALQPEIDSLLAAFDLCASLWNDSSEICRVNRNEDIELSEAFCDMLAKSQQVSELTGGVFDVTVGPLVQAYGFTPGGGPSRLPGDEELIEILQYVGWQKVRIEDSRLVKDHPLLRLDFNAIAQGYCSDMVSEYLESKGIATYLVDIGGEIRARGLKPDGSSWVVGIEKPAPDSLAQQNILQKLALTDNSIVTSGNYRKYFEAGGQRYSHTINPQTGRPVQHNLLSATILCKDCWEADALATACMVWGTDSSRAFLQKHPEYEAYLIYTEPVPGTDSLALRTWCTPGFSTLILE